MVCKKIRKQSGSVLSIVLMMLMVVFTFTAGYLWFNQGLEDNNQTIDSKYTTTYQRLQNASNSIDDNVQAIENNLEEIKEADTAYQVAWNGLKGLGNTLKLPINFVSNGIEIFSAIIIPMDFIPQWAKNLITIGLIITIVLIVVAVLKGDNSLIG